MNSMCSAFKKKKQPKTHKKTPTYSPEKLNKAKLKSFR